MAADPGVTYLQMHSYTDSNPRPSLAAILLGLGLLGSAMAAAAQQAPVVPQTVTTPSAIQFDPTRPEIQPSLTIDRDPVLSPERGGNTPQPIGQSLQKQGTGTTYTLRQNVNEVLLRCAVVDSKDRLVRTLTQHDFHIQEDGLPETVNYFDHSDQPASIGILVDNSGSMLGKHAAVAEAAAGFMASSNPKDTAFVVNFSDRAYLDQGFTSSLASLKKGLAYFDSSGYTALYDAIAVSADELSDHGKWPAQALLIITDGQDDASRLSLQQTIRRVQQLGGPVVYAIGLLYDSPDPQEAERARSALQSLSAETGGIAYFPRSLAEVGEIAQAVASDIRNEYIIGYNPPGSAGGGYRTVSVEAEANGYGRLTVRTRKGYYPGRSSPGLTPVVQKTGQAPAAPDAP